MSTEPNLKLVEAIMSQDPTLKRGTARALANITERLTYCMDLLKNKYDACPSDDPRAAGARDLAIGAESALQFGRETIEVSCRVVLQIAQMALAMPVDGDVVDSGRAVSLQAAKDIALAGFRAAVDEREEETR